MSVLEFAVVQLIKLVLFVPIIWFSFNYEKIKERIAGLKLSKTKSLLREGLEGCRYSLGDWKKTVLLPAIIGVVLYLALAFILQLPAAPEAPLFAIAVLIIVSGIVAPVVEEFAYRAILIGSGLPTIKYRFNQRGTLITAGVLLFSTLIFTLSHDLSSIPLIAEHFVFGLVLGLIYLHNGRNLLPPVIAHAAFNLMVIFG